MVDRQRALGQMVDKGLAWANRQRADKGLWGKWLGQTKSRQRALGQTVRQTKGFGVNGGSIQRVWENE